MELAVEIEWEKTIETHLFEECEDTNNDRRGCFLRSLLLEKKMMCNGL